MNKIDLFDDDCSVALVAVDDLVDYVDFGVDNIAALEEVVCTVDFDTVDFDTVVLTVDFDVAVLTVDFDTVVLTVDLEIAVLTVGTDSVADAIPDHDCLQWS